MHCGGGAHASVPIYSIIVLLQQSIMFSSDSGPHAEEIDIYVCTWTLIIHLCLSYTHMFPRTYVCVFHTFKKIPTTGTLSTSDSQQWPTCTMLQQPATETPEQQLTLLLQQQPKNRKQWQEAELPWVAGKWLHWQRKPTRDIGWQRQRNEHD